MFFVLANMTTSHLPNTSVRRNGDQYAGSGQSQFKGGGETTEGGHPTAEG